LLSKEIILMRKLALVALLIGVVGLAPLTASAQTQVATPTPAKNDLLYPLVLAAGALAGVAAVNAVTYGVGTLPVSLAYVSTAPTVSPAAAAASRIFVITSGVFGAWFANWLYSGK